MSEVPRSREGRVSQRPRLPTRPAPPPRRRAGAPRRIVREGCGVSGSPGEGRPPAQAPPPRPDSAQLEAGPARGREAGKGPGGWAEAPRGSDPASPGLAARGRLSPKPAPPVPARAAARARDRSSLWRALPAAARTRKKTPGEGGTPNAQSALPVRRQIAATRCCRRCGPRAPSARAQPGVPWSPRGKEGAVPGETPSRKL